MESPVIYLLISDSIMSQTALILAFFFVMFIFLEETRLNEGSQKKGPS